MKKYRVVDVRWVSPRTGMLAPPNKMLSLDDHWNCESVPFVAYRGADEFGEPREMFLFQSGGEAEAFKYRVESNYKGSPSYFVINDDGERVLDEDGKAVVAWEPEITVSAVSETTVAAFWPEYFAELRADREFLRQCESASDSKDVPLGKAASAGRR